MTWRLRVPRQAKTVAPWVWEPKRVNASVVIVEVHAALAGDSRTAEGSCRQFARIARQPRTCGKQVPSLGRCLLALDMGSPGSVTALNRPCGMSCRKSNSGVAGNRRKGAIGVMRCVHVVTLLSEATKCLTGPKARLYNDAAKRALKLRHLQAELTLGSAYGFLTPLSDRMQLVVGPQ